MPTYVDLCTYAAAGEPPSTIAGCAGTIPYVKLPAEMRNVINRVKYTNTDWKAHVKPVAWLQANPDHCFHIGANFGQGIRSAHGNTALAPQPYPAMPANLTPLQYTWYAYADGWKTQHCPLNCVPSYIEFTVSGAPGADASTGPRMLYDYMRDGFVAVPDHYVTFYEVT